jgi:predicted O-methyltransferase YrrM
MEYREFFDRFGVAYRRKHLAPRTLLGALAARWRNGRRAPKPKRSFALPAAGELPRDFIRQDPWEAEYLFLIASQARRGILETGRFNGGSAFLFACANARVPIYSIDIAPQDDRRVEQLLKRHRVGENVRLIVGDSQRTRYPGIDDIDLLFVDGDHSYEGCSNDLQNWYPLVVRGGHVLLHDCYFGCEVQRAAIDFMNAHDVLAIQPPYIPASHMFNPSGSLAHFVRRS